MDQCITVTADQVGGYVLVYCGCCKKKKKYKSSDLNNSNISSPDSGDWKSKVKVSTGLVPSESSEGRICFRPISFVCLHGALPVYMCVSQFSLFIRTPVIWD